MTIPSNLTNKLNAAEMRARSWFHVPALPRSWHFRKAGARERNFLTGTRERGTQKSNNANFLLLPVAQIAGNSQHPLPVYFIKYLM